MKKLKIILVVCVVIVAFWSAMLITDTIRSNEFMEPVFAQMQPAESDDLSYEYRGIGYTVNMSFYADESGTVFPESAEVRLFGILVSAVIV